jgi:exopolysaccharide biosynthesis protein
MGVMVAILLSAVVMADTTSVLGTQTSARSTDLAEGTTLYRTTYYNTSQKTTQAENMVVFQPGTVMPVVAFGDTLYGRSTLSTTASYVNKSTGLAVVAGINASFFEFSSGIPYGMEITNGVLRTSGSTAAVGFTETGAAIIGNPGLTISLSSSVGSYASVNYNKAMSTGSGLVLYSRDYDTATKAGMATYNVVLRPTSSELHIGDTVTAEVVQSSTYAESTFSIPQNCWVLSIAAGTTYQTAITGFLSKLKVGDQLTFTVSANAGWQTAVSACGAGDLLVVNGVAQTSFPFSATSAAKRTARTAIGVKSDGSILLYTVDGDQETYSDGLTLSELAQRMVELGCVNAINLDGGGSTTMAATIQRSYATINKPSDNGSQRKVANGIYLVTALENLPGASTATTVSPSTSPEESLPDDDDSTTATPKPSPSATTTTVTTPSTSTTVTTPASSASTEAVSAASGVTTFGFESSVVTSGTGITAAANSDLTYVKYGKGSVQLTYDLSQVTSNGRRQVVATASLPTRDDRLSLGVWVYGDGSGNALSVKYTQNGEPASLWIGQLTFTGWSYLTTTLPLGTEAITGFAVTEQDSTVSTSGTIYLDQLLLSTAPLSDTTAPTFSINVGSDQLLVGVTDDESGVDTITVTIDGVKTAYTWQNSLAAIALPSDGDAHLVVVTAKDGSGNLSAVSYEVSGNVSAPFADTEGHWAETALAALARRGIISGTTDEATGQLLYRPNEPMTRQDFAVTLINWLGVDASQYANVTLPFVDTDSISASALNAVKAAYSLGYMTGAANDGKLYCNPNGTVTRQEAMALIGRTQDQGYALASLSSFSDGSSVPTWAATHIAAMVTRGVISGTSDGRLDPTGTVTRAQVVKMLYTLG